MSGRAILRPMRLTDPAAGPAPRWANLQIALAAFVLVASAFSSVAAVHFATARGGAEAAIWREISWPFPRDGWPAGRAFRCESCGGVELYVRPKIGFCNCTTGVADDDEVDRVADLDLISARFVPTDAGKIVHVADMAGRSRSYDLKMSDGAQHTAVGIALSRHCDLLVAVAQGRAAPPQLQHAALDYLATHEMHRWMITALSGR
jgi:hypothetical protein